MNFDPEQLAPKPTALLGIRHLQYILMFIVIVIGYGMRTILNVAILAIIGDSDDDDNEEKNYPTYPSWASEKNIILSSFFWGYVCFQVVAGQTAKRYGAKYILVCAIFITSLFTLFIPLFGAKFGYGGVIACRIVEGATQGFLFPSIHTLLSVWTPLSERVKWGGVVYAGQSIGNVIAMPLTGAIAASNSGWPVAFYLYGSVGILWCVFWFFFGSASPAKDSRISKEERKWIESEIDDTDDKEKIPTPWKAIFTSKPFYAILITHCGQSWGFWTLMTEIPSYMKNILEFNIASNSMLSALPYFVLFILNMIMSPLADYIIKQKYVSLGTSRKIFNTIGLVGPALSLITLSIVGSGNKTVVIILLVLAVGTNAGTYCGFNINHIDLSPVHAGPLMGITNSSAAIFGILAPLAVDLMSKISGYKEDQEELWQIVFYVAAAIYIAVAIIFIIFGSGEVQPWNRNHVEDSQIQAGDSTDSRRKKSSIHNQPVEVQKKISYIYNLQ